MYENVGPESGRVLLPRERGAAETRLMLKGPAWLGGLDICSLLLHGLHPTCVTLGQLFSKSISLFEHLRWAAPP